MLFLLLNSANGDDLVMILGLAICLTAAELIVVPETELELRSTLP